MHATPICLSVLLILGGCSGQVAAPSLMPRAVERQSIDLPANDPAEATNAVDPALQSALAAHLAAAAQADQAFSDQRRGTEASIGRAANARPGSDAWIEAQQAITALEALRAPLRDEAAAIDGLRDDPANAAPGNPTAIDGAAARIAQLDKAEGAVIGALTARLR